MIRQVDLLCPSGRPEPGSEVIGAYLGDAVSYINPPIPVRTPLPLAVRHLRFAERCAEESCLQWDGIRCGLIEYLATDEDENPDLPKCGIRHRCRWFAQRAGAACSVCSLIVREPIVDHRPPE